MLPTQLLSFFQNKRELLLFVTLIIVVLFLHWDVRSLLGDETGTAFVANNLSYSDIFYEKYVGDFNPFGYFLLNKLVVSIFGFNEVSFRLLPAFFYALSIILFMQILIELQVLKETSKYIIYFFSFNPLVVYYSVFARAYSLLLGISLLLVYCLIQWHKTGKNKWGAAYSIALVFGIYNHFFVGFFAVVLFISVVTLYWKEIGFSFCGRWLGFSLIAVLCFVPEALSFLDKSSEVSAITQRHATSGYLMKFGFVGYGLLFGESLRPNVIVAGLLLLCFLFILVEMKWKTLILGWKPVTLSLIIVLSSVFLISFTGFARPMYVIFVSPFMAYLLAKLYVEFKIQGVLILILLSFHSTLNLLSGSYLSFISPQITLKYKKILPNLLQNLKDKELLLFTPSHNEVLLDLYGSSSKSNYKMINAFHSPLSTLDKLDLDNENTIHLIYEHQVNGLLPKLIKGLSAKGFILEKRRHHIQMSSFLTNSEYTLFGVFEFKKVVQ